MLDTNVAPQPDVMEQALALLATLGDPKRAEKLLKDAQTAATEAKTARDEANELIARASADQASADRRYDDAVKIERKNATATADIEKREADVASKLDNIANREKALAASQRSHALAVAQRDQELTSLAKTLETRADQFEERERIVEARAAEYEAKLAALKKLAG